MDTITISTQTITYLAITCILLFILPVAVYLFWKMKNGKNVNFVPLLFGIVGFIVSVRILEMIPHIFCILLDNPVSRFINGNTWAYVLYGITMAGVFEECGRYLILKYIWKKNQTRENVITYGIGHGGIEVWAVTLLAVVMYLVTAIMIRSQGLEATMTSMNVAGGAEEAFLAMVNASIVSFDAGMMALTILERVAAMTLHIALSVVVYYGVKNNRKIYLLLAIAAHAVFDIFPALFQRAVVSMGVCEIWICAWAVISAIGAFVLYRKMKPKES